MAIWTLQDLTLHGTNRPRLDGVSLQIDDGVTAIVGFSGAGKSSLLSVLAGMERPDAGTVRHDHSPPLSHDARGDATKSGARRPETRTPRLPLFWAPETGGLWPHMTVREHLTAVREPATVPPADSGPATSGNSTDKLLAEFDLTHRQHASPGQLSQGEQSRLAIARALATDAAVLLFDEPLAHVDPARRPKYWTVIRQHGQRRESSLVFATHDPDIVLREARQVICLDEGRVMYHGAVHELYDNPPDERAAMFLGPVNWFSSDDAPMWLDHGEQCCVRPERVILTAEEDSPIEVVSSQFCGSFAETTLRRPDCGERMFLHRPAGAGLKAGQRVKIEARREGDSG